MTSESKARTLCEQHLGCCWLTPDQVSTSTLAGGYVNSLIVCERSTDCQGCPKKVIVRLTIDRDIFQRIGAAGQALALKALADAGVGPRLLGVFEGGRIEEFIEGGHMMTSAEGRDPEVLRACAKSLAIMHSLEVPIAVQPCWSEFLLDVLARADQKVRQSDVIANLGTLRPEIAGRVITIMKMDYLSEYKWLLTQMPKIRGRKVTLTHSDHYANNVVIRKRSDGTIEAFNVDVEMCSHFYRGVDVGMFLYELRHDFADPKNPLIVGELPPELERLFMEEYLHEWIRINPDKTDPELDCYHSLLIESRYCHLIVCCYFVLTFLEKLTNGENYRSFPERMLDFLIERDVWYKERKHELIDSVLNC